MTRDVIYILAIVILGFLLFRTCHGSDDVKRDRELSQIRDSVKILKLDKAFADSAYNQLGHDYSAFQTWASDSIAKLNRVMDDLSSDNDLANVRVKNLIRTAREAATAAHDTAALRRIDEGEALAAEKERVIQGLKTGDKQKDSIYAAEIVACTKVSDKRDSMYQSLSSMFNRLEALQERTIAKAERLSLAEKKRIVIGPSVGVGIGASGKVTPVVGVSVSYRLIRL